MDYLKSKIKVDEFVEEIKEASEIDEAAITEE